MNDIAQKKAQEVIYRYKLLLDRQRVPSNIEISHENALVRLITKASEEKC